MAKRKRRLSLLEFMGPELPSPANKHKFPRPIKQVGGAGFPYDAGEPSGPIGFDNHDPAKPNRDPYEREGSQESQEERVDLEDETGIDFPEELDGLDRPIGVAPLVGESMSIMELFYGAPSIKKNILSPPGYPAKGGGSAGGATGGKSTSNAANYAPNPNLEDPKDVADTRALPTEWLNGVEDGDDEKGFDEYFLGGSEEPRKEQGLKSEGIGAREKATKEMGSVSTDQPFFGGISGEENLTTEDDIDPEEELDELEDDVELPMDGSPMRRKLSIEGICLKIMKEWATDDFASSLQHHAGRAKADEEFFDKRSGDHFFCMNTEEEFNDYQKERKGKDEKSEDDDSCEEDF